MLCKNARLSKTKERRRQGSSRDVPADLAPALDFEYPRRCGRDGKVLRPEPPEDWSLDCVDLELVDLGRLQFSIGEVLACGGRQRVCACDMDIVDRNRRGVLEGDSDGRAIREEFSMSIAVEMHLTWTHVSPSKSIRAPCVKDVERIHSSG